MHLRTLVTLLAALALVAGCGGDDEAADSSTDVDALLEETFAGGKAIDSGRISLALDVSSEKQGQPLKVSISGPFQSQGKGRLPQIDLDASLEGAGQSLSGGVITTPDAGFVTIGDATYEVAGPVYEQFKAGYEQAAKDSSGKQDQSLATLGVDPRRWLTNAQNAGASKVGDTETIKITGDVDVPKLLDDVNGALEKVRGLGVQGSDQLPDKLTEAEKRETAEAVDDLSVEIHTGAEDRILRRIVVTLQPHRARRRWAGRRAVRPPAAGRQRGPDDRGARRRQVVRRAADPARRIRARRPRRTGRRRRRRRRAAERRRVRRLRGRGGRRQREGPQVRGPPDDPVAADAA